MFNDKLEIRVSRTEQIVAGDITVTLHIDGNAIVRVGALVPDGEDGKAKLDESPVVFERIAEVIRNRRRFAGDVEHAQHEVCPIHGYVLATKAYGCPTCDPEPPAAKAIPVPANGNAPEVAF